jgi:hypothetical protein
MSLMPNAATSAVGGEEEDEDEITPGYIQRIAAVNTLPTSCGHAEICPMMNSGRSGSLKIQMNSSDKDLQI